MKTTAVAEVKKSPLVDAALTTLFALAARAPWVLRLARPLAIRLAVFASPELRDGTAANARRIVSGSTTPPDERRFARDVVGEFYDFVVDIARSADCSAEMLRSQIGRIEGKDGYLAARDQHRGAVLVTAHIGSFEVGMAALTLVEKQIHVVFKRDRFARFEAIRSKLRARLGVIEAPIDDGWQTLLQLKEALASDQVVVLQADRAMPGQRAQRVPVLGGHLLLPAGPVTLARLGGSPIVPVFTVRTAPGKFDVHLGEAIWIDADARPVDGVDPAMQKIGDAIAGFIAKYPTQWLVLEPAFVEDRPILTDGLRSPGKP